MADADVNVYLRVLLGTVVPADISQQVIRVDVQDEDRGTDCATVVLDNPAQANTDAIREGNEVRIEMGWRSEHALLFVGRVHRTQTAAQASGGSRITVTCLDVSVRMNGRPATPNRQHVGTLRDILTALATEAEIAMGEVRLDPMPSWSVEDPLPQGTKTTWQMIQDLAEEYGARAFVEVNSQPGDTDAQREAGGVPRLYFISMDAMLAQEPLGRLTYCAGFGSLQQFDITRVGGGAAPSAETTVVDPVSGEVRTESGPPPASDPPASLSPGQTSGLATTASQPAARAAEAAVDLANRQPVQPNHVRPRARPAGTPSDPALARRLVRQDPTRVLGLFGQGLAMGTVFLRAKGCVEIDGLASSANGRWYLRRVNHIIEQATQTNAGGRRLTRQTYRTRIEATR
jgi:phage protein D